MSGPARDPRIDILLDFLDRYRGELTSALHRVPRESRELRPPDGGWSAANVVEHLALTERALTRLLAGALTTAELRHADEALDASSFEQTIHMPAFLDRSRKIRGSQPTGLLSAQDAWASLDASRRDLRDALNGARGRRLEDFVREHPATGTSLNGYQWIAFIGLHEGRHAAQIVEIAASLAGLSGL